MAGAPGSTGETPTPKASPQKGNTNGNKTSPRAATPKKTKAKTPKSAVKAEETSVKAEETTDNNATGDADNGESTATPTKKRARAPAKPKYDENGNVISPKKRVSAAQKAAQKAIDDAAEAEAQQKQKQTDDLVTRLLTAKAHGLDSAAYEQVVGDDEILQEHGNDANVTSEETGDGDDDHKMTQDEEDEKLFDTSMYDKKVDPVNNDAADLMDAEEA